MKNEKLAEIFATFFYCGKIKYAPGTFASAVAAILWFFITNQFAQNFILDFYENLFWISSLIFLTFFGTLAIEIYAKKLDEIDHSSIVIDEIVGQILALFLSYFFVKEYYRESSNYLSSYLIFLHIFMSFFIFRIFDITKPSLIGFVDKNMKNGFGVILDDILSGVCAAIFNIILFFVCKNFVVI